MDWIFLDKAVGQRLLNASDILLFCSPIIRFRSGARPVLPRLFSCFLFLFQIRITEQTTNRKVFVKK